MLIKSLIRTGLIPIMFLSVNHVKSQVYYKGEWTKIGTEANFNGLLKLEIKDSIVKGEIIWIFKAIDSADIELVKYYKGQKGKMGIEFVKGYYTFQTNDIRFEGDSKTDPEEILGLDKYLLKLSADKNVIYGRTFSNGENNGLVYFYRSNQL